ncbi:MAG: M90 family metallopeptidase, partial [Burkholderiales bacterium]
MLNWLRKKRPVAPSVPEALWKGVLARHGFLAVLAAPEQDRLRALANEFHKAKEFHGGHGFAITDDVALSIAAQAVLPVLHLDLDGEPRSALRWYDDFVGIVVHPGEVVARREITDESGVVHHYDEVLAGEAMEGGPVMLSWQDVQRAGQDADSGYNVVIHEFVHKIDMRDGAADGCPPLPAGFLGTDSIRAAREAWMAVFQPAYDQ